MENLIGALGAVVPVFLVVGLGWILRKTGFLSDAFVRDLSKFLFVVAYTCKLGTDLYAADVTQILDARMAVYSVVAITAVTVLAMCMARVLTKDNRERFALSLTAYRGNYFMMYSVLENMYGGMGAAGAVVMTIVFTPMVNILAAVLSGVYAKAESPGQMCKNILVKTAKTPMLIGVLIGMALNLTHVPVPEVLLTPMRNIGACAMPMAMIALGAQMCVPQAKKSVRLIVWGSAFRLIAVPVLVLTGAILLGYRGPMLAALLPMCASPAAVSNFPVARQMGADVELTNALILTTTVLSAFTLCALIPLLTGLGFI